MSTSLPKSIDHIKDAASRLNAITDAASVTVRELENFLNEVCSIGIHAWVKVREDADQHVTSTQYLEYRRVGQRYRIAVVWGNDVDPEHENVKPWSDCSRDEKLETVALLPELIEVVAKKVDEKIRDAESASLAVSNVLESLRQRGGI